MIGSGSAADVTGTELALLIGFGIDDGSSAPVHWGALPNVTLQMSREEGHAWFNLVLLATSYLEWGAGGLTMIVAWRAMQPCLSPICIHAIDTSV